MSGRPKRASAIAGVAAATAALRGPVSTGHAPVAAPATAPTTGAALQPAVTGSRQSQRGRIEKKDTFGFVWGGGKPKQEPQAAPQKAAASSKDKSKIAGSSTRPASKRRRDDGAQKKRKRVRIRVRGATSPRQPAGFDAVGAAVAAPRVRLVLGQAPSLPRDVLKEEGRSGSSLKTSKLFGTQFSSKYRSTFAANIRSFIARHGDELVVPGLLSHLKLEEDVPDAECSIMRGWKIKMKTDDGSFWLRIYEDRSQSTCYQCSCLGWGAAPRGLATTSKFHIVVVSATVVPVCAGAAEQVTKAVLSLHGVLHSNGAGHLRHVNGKEGGGEHTGTLMMQVWDSLCVALGARMVSVQDVSARSGMYLRFTHAVANGRTWYGKWQYGFQRGSFGLQSKDYAEAVSALREVSFDQLGADLRDPSLTSELTRLAQRYQQGDGTISTLSRLFQKLMVSCRRSTTAASSFSAIDPATALADLYTVSCQICTKARAAATSSIREATDVGANSSTAARWVTTILDCKWFAKDYTRRPDVTGLLRVRCTLREPHHICCPGPRLEEDVFVNESARVKDFLREATAVLRTVYPPLANFNATGLRMEGSLCNEVDETPMRTFARGREQFMPVLVELEGSGIDMGRPEVETVRCSCGATDDDGERMLACEVCGTWMHSRCIGLNDDEDVAEKFSDGFCCSVCFMKKDEGESTGKEHLSSLLQPTMKTEESSSSSVPVSSGCPDSPAGSSFGSGSSLGDLDMNATVSFGEGELWS